MDPSGDSGGGLTATAGLICAACGTALPPDSRFCNRCGASIAPAATTAEYKQVTVLFADVVHSMDIAAAVGPERLREIMAELLDRSTAVVKRYGGTVDKFTGDGIMAVYGAPVTLEDHAFRACLAGLDIQKEVGIVAAEVHRLNGIMLQLRIGLNSGQVIAGEIGSATGSYTTIGEQVGMAQRMESAAPPGGVMLSESTARLVEHATVLGEVEKVHVKGVDAPVAARRLLDVAPHRERTGFSQEPLVGRELEVATISGLLDRSASGRGSVVCVVGSAGIGKTRIVHETAATARRRGVEVFSTFCESHTSDVPFHVVARLLRADAGVGGLGEDDARARVREQVLDADPEDLLLLYDLLGIADPDAALPRIDPDARRRRLTELVNAASLARTQPALYVIEDAHWIDEVSESMLADFFAVIPQTPSMVLITYRPEYEGALTRIHSAQTIALAPLSDSETSAMVARLLGPDATVGGLGEAIVARAAGNPFFVQEMIRDLAERGVLQGTRGSFVCHTDAADVSVPATLQATIAARIDRLEPDAKQTLNAAAVIGSRFTTEVLAAVGDDPVLDELLKAELIDQVRFKPSAEFAFRHPLIRTVAYESQLKSDRAELHRRLAASIQELDTASADENAALIAEHLEAAGDLQAAYGWHMRAATWATNRDIGAARLSWERAQEIADALPTDHPNRAAMRIAPRALLCAHAYRLHVNISGGRFEELRQLCAEAGDKASLALGMAGLATEHLSHGRMREASRLATETMMLVQSVGNPTLTVQLSVVAATMKLQTGEIAEALRWSQTVIDLAGDDAAKGRLSFLSPLAAALALRGIARCALGDREWRGDLHQAVAIARTDLWSHAQVITYTSGLAIASGVLQADDAALSDIDEALETAERSSDDLAVGFARWTKGVALVHQVPTAERDGGLAALAQVRDMCLRGRFTFLLPAVDLYTAREKSRRGDRGAAVPLMREAVDELFERGQFQYCIVATGALVETLLEGSADNDVAEAEAAIERLEAAPTDGLAVREIWLLRLRTLSARAHGDEAAYRDYRDRYRAMAKTLGFEGHIAWAEAMP